MTYVWPQMYNQGPANGFKGYPDGSKTAPGENRMAQFLANMAWATTTDEGYAHNGGRILSQESGLTMKIPKDKLVLGIPAAQGAAGGLMAYVAKPHEITRAYTLAEEYGAKIAGFMTWSADFDNMLISHYGYTHQPWSTVKAIAQS